VRSYDPERSGHEPAKYVPSDVNAISHKRKGKKHEGEGGPSGLLLDYPPVGCNCGEQIINSRRLGFFDCVYPL